MTAREYLEQIAVLDYLIKSKAQDVGRFKNMARGTSAKLGGERVQSSGGSKQTMADYVVKYVDSEVEIKEFIEKRQEIINTMKKLPQREYDTLYKIYVLGYRLNELAYKHRKSYSWAKKEHRKALNKLQKLLNERIV